ncbi:Glucose-induced degradation protein 8 [Intoshia linei]|uniref:Glucose-induced degradation protein 8 n=1 Tax=Intoshia linei TaxID=1819745 RepID=A0A177B3Y3_9BILA|nr:Glucose-induced degradation protein 8 [Intoshia linei]
MQVEEVSEPFVASGFKYNDEIVDGQSVSTPLEDNKISLGEEWETDFCKKELSRNKLNEIVLEYLYNEGYKSTAECFNKESKLYQKQNYCKVLERRKIMEFIYEGNIMEAINMINEEFIYFFHTNPAMYFELQLQQLIEFVRKSSNKVDMIQFAQINLIPYCDMNPSILESIEEVISFIIFDDYNLSPNKHLLDQSKRDRVAEQVNRELMKTLHTNRESMINYIYSVMHWSQEKLEANNATFTKLCIRKKNQFQFLLPPYDDVDS